MYVCIVLQMYATCRTNIVLICSSHTYWAKKGNSKSPFFMFSQPPKTCCSVQTKEKAVENLKKLF